MDATDSQIRATGPGGSNVNEIQRDGTPHSIKVGRQGRGIESKKKTRHIKVTNDEMSNKWALIKEPDEWFDTCLQGQLVPQTILDAVSSDKSSAFPHNESGEVAYYPVLVSGVTLVLRSLVLKSLVVRNFRWATSRIWPRKQIFCVCYQLQSRNLGYGYET